MNVFQLLLIQPLTNGLIFFYQVLGHNMGFAIIGFSLLLRLILNPLTKPYMDSMKRMKDLSPLLEKLKEKYKGDKAKLAQAQADFYKEKGINPGSGCLPYILQIVILIALFNVFVKILSTDGVNTTSLNEILYPPLRLGQEETLNTKFLYLDVAKPDVFRIPSLPVGIPWPILVLSALIQVVSAKMMSPVLSEEEKLVKKTKSKEDDFAVAMQNSTIYTIPLFTIVFGMSFPSGLALYWLFFSLFQAFQQYRASGWGGMKPLLLRLGLLELNSQRRLK